MVSDEQVERAVRVAELAAQLISLGVVAWMILPRGVQAQLAAQVAKGRGRWRRLETERVERSRLDSELWHIRRAMREYNRHRDPFRFALSLGVRSDHHPFPAPE